MQYIHKGCFPNRDQNIISMIGQVPGTHSNAWLLGNFDGDTGSTCAQSRGLEGDCKMARQKTSMSRSLDPVNVTLHGKKASLQMPLN